MVSAPYIYLFRTLGGPPVARGVLIRGQQDARIEGQVTDIGAAGLFKPWPVQLTGQDDFGVYLPASGVIAEEWLTPAKVGVLDLPDGSSLGIVSFTSEPADDRGAPPPGEHPNDFHLRARKTNDSWLTALKNARGDELAQLERLDPSAPAHATPPLGKAGKPEMLPNVSIATSDGSFVCRYILRWD
jgi:hypothetical protein